MLPINTTSQKFENTFQNRRAFSENRVDEILRQYTLLNIKQLKQFWNGYGRAYHNWEHAQYMLFLALEYKDQIEKTTNFDSLVLSILFHDIIYVPGSRHNEHVSAEMFRACLKPEIDYGYTGVVYSAIKRTQYLALIGEPVKIDQDPLTWWLQMLDLYPLIVNDRGTCLLNFVLVWDEFKHLCNGDSAMFEDRQNQFLSKLATEFGFEYEPITWEEVKRKIHEPIEW